MKSDTIVNKKINPTEGNALNNTVVNPIFAGSDTGVSLGTVIDNKYKIVKLLANSGEADLFVCEYLGKKYVAKIYRREAAVKGEIIKKLLKIESPYIAKLYYFGEINGKMVEILPYYAKGSLEGKRFTLKQIKETILPCINEALHVLHSQDIIHKDIKPSNIMELENGKVAIIDFGISSVLEKGNTVLYTKTGMTPEYSAPESSLGLFLEVSDYYSVGMTLYELFIGHLPYTGMTTEEKIRYSAIQQLPFPPNTPDEFVGLINGLTYRDISHRKEKDNPNRRWTYNEVNNWCKNIEQAIPGSGKGASSNGKSNEDFRYPFNGITYTNVGALTLALAKNWNDGKKQLYRGILTKFFMSNNPEIATICSDFEQEFQNDSINEDVLFFKFIYRMNPKQKEFIWINSQYESLPAFGDEIQSKLWDNKPQFEIWNSILSNGLLSIYCNETNITNSTIKNKISAYERKCDLKQGCDIKTYYELAYLLNGNTIFKFKGCKVATFKEFTDYLEGLLRKSVNEFDAFCNSIIRDDYSIDPQFEAWMIRLGHYEKLRNWKRTIVLKYGP